MINIAELTKEDIGKWVAYKAHQRAEKEEGRIKSWFDARLWVKGFVKAVKENPEIATDADTMLAWFASAIMAGYDKGRQPL